MKVTIKRKTFLEGLEIVKDSIGRQTALPILRNVKLTSKEGSLRLHTTNLSIGTTALLKDASISSDGEVLCDALKLMAIVKELPETEVKLETDEKGHLLLECEKSHFRLFTAPPDEFPSQPEIPKSEFFPIGDQFFQYLRKVKYAASKEENRYNIHGLFLGAEVVATDGHRMAVIRRKLGFNNILLPLDFASMILKLRSRSNGNTFHAACFNNLIFIRSEDLTLFGRLIDGEFPDYSQVIPHDPSRHALVERKGLIQAIKRILLMSGKNCEMKLEFQPHSLTLSSFMPDLGDAAEEIEVEYGSDTDGNQPFTIGLNGKYLLEMLEVLENEKVALGMHNEFSPIKAEEDDSIHILMPLRLFEPQTEAESDVGTEAEPEAEAEQEDESMDTEEAD